MINLLLGLIKPTTKILTTVVNSRRPLAVKGFASVFALLGVGLNYEDMLPLIDTIYHLPYGKFMLGSAIFVTVFATKDIAGVVINVRLTLIEIGNLIKTIFKPLVALFLACKSLF